MHDVRYKLLFSHAEMVEDLLRGFVPHAWVQALDFSTLEKVNASYVTDDLRDRHDDVVWRVRFQEHWLYVYLLLEFQSTVDRFMAVRILSYTGLLYQDLIRSQSLHQDRLPPVLPIVLYNGEPRWKAAVELSELIHPAPQELQAYQPQQRYLLLDEGAYPESALPQVRNLVAAVFRLENGRNAENVLAVITALLDWLQGPQQAGLRRSFTIWIQRVILADHSAIPHESLLELEEVHTMLAQRVQQWKQEWRTEGLEEGRAEGRTEGRTEGLAEGLEKGLEKGLQNERSMLLRMVDLRFGAETVTVLMPLLDRVTDPEQLTQVGEWIILCATGEELLEHTRTLVEAPH